MPEITGSANNAGSPINGAPNPNSFSGQVGQAPQNNAPRIDPEQYKNLEQLVGRQGTELGEYRKYFEEITPLLERLDKNPDLVHAILDNKLTPDLAKAAMEGKISVQGAQIVQQAHTEVKKELGKAGYQNASPEDIQKLVNDKVAEVKGDLQKQMQESEDIRTFEQEVNEFITRTPDFANYAGAIDKWIDDHDITDIAVAYYAVKGELSEKEAAQKANEDQAEFQKQLASNAQGGYGQRTSKVTDANIIDSLIAPKSNPNNFS